MSTYDPKAVWAAADKKVVLGILKACHHFKADRVEALATFETAIVESGVKALNYGDRDSVGAFQQRAGWGTVADRIDPYKSATKFLEAARSMRKKTSRAGVLAYDVQRCAYAYRNRYSQAYAAAKYMIDEAEKLAVQVIAASAVPVKPTAPVTAPAAPAPKVATVSEIHAAAAASGASHPRRDAARAISRQRAASGKKIWYRKCEFATRTALGCPGGTDTAYHTWLAVPAAHRHTGVPEAGTAFYFESKQGSSGAGHAVVVEKPGKDVRSTTVWSNDIKENGLISLTTIGHIEDAWGEKPLGWVTSINGQDF